MSNKNINNKKVKINKNFNNGKINTKKVFPHKGSEVKVEEISIDEALSSRVKRNQKLYTNSISSNKKENHEKFSNTKQQKFNFDSKKVQIEDDIDTNFLDNKRKKKSSTKTKQKKVSNKPVSVKVEDIPINKTLKNNYNKNDYMTVIMLFLTVVIVFMGTFLIYHFGTFDHTKPKIKYKNIEIVPENIVFLGDSITEQYDLKKYFPKRKVVNSGISGNTTQDILDDMGNRVYRYNPSVIFLLIGTNDLIHDKSNDDIVKNIKEIIREIKKNLPKTKLYLESIYPVNNSEDEKINSDMVENRNNDDIKSINDKLKKYAKKEKIDYINLYDKLVNEEGDLNLDYTVEGLHITDEGYEIITWELNKILKKL